jgi:peptidoglycan-associated lipoprotein
LCSVAAFLVGCGTSVPLNDVPVADGSVKGVATENVPNGVGGAGVNSNNVTQIDLSKNGDQSKIGNAPNIVYFDYDSFVIKPEFQSIITAQARIIKSQPSRKMAVEGHTDETGGREYNLALGQKRAEAVVGALAILGVPHNQMEAVSFGKEKPAVTGTGEPAYSKNRRVELRAQ